jgi:hypothetical protein
MKDRRARMTLEKLRPSRVSKRVDLEHGFHGVVAARAGTRIGAPVAEGVKNLAEKVEYESIN